MPEAEGDGVSEQTEAVRSRVTHEWQTTEDIAGDRYPSPIHSVACRTLLRMEREGVVEKGWVRAGSGCRTRVWRLRR